MITLYKRNLNIFQLFLMALDDTLPKNLNASSNDKGPVGCTSLIINQPNAQVNQYNVYNIPTNNAWSSVK